MKYSIGIENEMETKEIGRNKERKWKKDWWKEKKIEEKEKWNKENKERKSEVI